MTDEEFVGAFENCTLPPEAFHHREHLRLAWCYLRAMDYEAAAAAMERSIRRFAGHHGASGKYHHTMTLVWMRLVAAALAADPGRGFDAFVERHPELLDLAAPSRFYSRDVLGSDRARAGWVEPDLHPLPEALTTVEGRNQSAGS